MPAITDSSLITHIIYDDSTNEMEVTFTSGNAHLYQDVPKSLYEEFIASKSKGSFFVKNIKNKFIGDRAAK